jgi:predicted dehydrogenase
MADGFSFNMGFTVNFEDATAVYDLACPQPLMLFQKGHDPEAVVVENVMGYELEIPYFLNCIQSGNRPTVVTLEDAVRTVQIVEAEVQSVQTGATVRLE